jgi:hypothetical protein
MVAGIKTYDSQSAVEFLTRQKFFDWLAKQNANWIASNFEIVIRTSIHEHTPGPPSVVAVRVWCAISGETFAGTGRQILCSPEPRARHPREID